VWKILKPGAWTMKVFWRKDLNTCKW
jgi:hypothetical protein